jgi:hypothetical protein
MKANIKKITKMSSDAKSNPTIIGEITTNGKRTGLIYQMFHNKHSIEIEINGIRNTEAKRNAVKQAVIKAIGE